MFFNGAQAVAPGAFNCPEHHNLFVIPRAKGSTTRRVCSAPPVRRVASPATRAARPPCRRPHPAACPPPQRVRPNPRLPWRSPPAPRTGEKARVWGRWRGAGVESSRMHTACETRTIQTYCGLQNNRSKKDGRQVFRRPRKYGTAFETILKRFRTIFSGSFWNLFTVFERFCDPQYQDQRAFLAKVYILLLCSRVLYKLRKSRLQDPAALCEARPSCVRSAPKRW